MALVGVALVFAGWWLYSWAAPILAFLGQVLGWAYSLLAALSTLAGSLAATLGFGATPPFEGPEAAAPSLNTSAGSVWPNPGDKQSPWNVSQPTHSLPSDAGSSDLEDPSAPPAEEDEGDLIDRAWQEEEAEMERRFGRRVAEIRGRSRSPSPSGSSGTSTRLTACGCPPPCVCKRK